MTTNYSLPRRLHPDASTSSSRRAKESAESAWSAWSDLGLSPAPRTRRQPATPPPARSSLRDRTNVGPLATPPPSLANVFVKGKGVAGRPTPSVPSTPGPERAETPSGRRSALSFSPRSGTSVSSIGGASLRSGLSALSSGLARRGRQSLGGGPRKEVLTWAQLRQELEGYLAEGQVIERCLTDVSFDDDDDGRALKELWDEQIWALAAALSPPLPAVLFPHPATGLAPLLSPLRSRLTFLALLPPAYVTSASDLGPLLDQAGSALAAARAIEAVVEVVSRKGLIRFELVGADEDGGGWKGEIKGKTGGGDRWKGWAALVQE